MKEFVLHYVWQHRLFVQEDLFTIDGRKLEIIDVGKSNMHAGPDFFNAKIKIDQTIWAGNVEIHTLSSDWNRHQHQQDAKYKNVILHVVKKADIPVFLPDGQPIPQLELHFSKAIEENIDSLLLSTKWVACQDKLPDLSELYWADWKTSLMAERMVRKSYKIYDLLSLNHNYWEETCFIVLAKSFGFSVNSEGFLHLAKAIPWTVILKLQDDLFSLEALLFGQAGLLKDCTDEYSVALNQMYKVLKAKYHLQTIDNQIWRMLRLRPDNFPYIRIAQLAYLLHKQSDIWRQIVACTDLEEWVSTLEKVQTSDYWKSHYSLGVASKNKDKYLGINSIYSIIINAFLPLLFTYSDRNQDEEKKNKALSFLEKIPAENNYIIRKWEELGVKVHSAADSQALIHLYKNYCDERNCLRCRIGYQVLTSSFKNIN